MSKAWPIVPLGEVLRESRVATPVSRDRSYPNFGIYSFGRGAFEKPPIDGIQTSASTLYRAKASQFVYSRLFAFEGAYTTVPDAFDGWYVSNEFPLFDCEQARLDVRFLRHWIGRKPTWTSIAESSTGMGSRRQRVQPEQLLRYRLPLPPLSEQRRIVARIEALAVKIAEVSSHQEAVEHAVGLHGRRSRADYVRNVSAPRQPLSELVEVRGGGTPSKANPLFWEGAIPWVSPKDMKVEEIFDAEDHISEEATEESSAKVLSPGSVLVVIRGMILAHTFPVAVLRVPATINQDMKALVPRPLIQAEYLAAVLLASNDEMLSLVDRSTHDTRKLLTEKLLSFEIPVPSSTEQRRIVAHLDALMAKTAALKQLQQQSAAELDALLPSILDRAFKGEL